MSKKITLLDGTDYDTKGLLKKMDDDSFYYGDLSKLALSSSSIKDLLDSPKTYAFRQKYAQKESQPLRDGWLFHTSILEPDVFEKQIFVDVQSKNTKIYKEAVAEHGKVFTIKEKNQAERLADAFLRTEMSLKYLGNSEFEVPAIGMVDGFPFRGKADILGSTSGGTGNRIVDLKTTNDIGGFHYSCKKYHYDCQVYIYCNLFNVPYQEFKFLVIDKGNLEMALAHCSEEFYLSGQAKVREGISKYKAFFQDGADLDNYYREFTL
tara:strand:- start:6138 stop:6932 length:795 start_codon:yes stop_codon:yes gene_type:complete